MQGEKKQSIASILLRFSLPLILSGVLQQLYNWADAFIVGNVNGELALAAIGATGTVVNLYIMAITGFTLGLCILFAQKFGAGETEAIPKILATFAALLGAAFLALAGAGIGLTGPLLRLMHTTADTVQMAQSYLRIVLIGVPFLAVYNVYAAALRGVGDSRAPFLAIVLSSAVNVALDVLFVARLRWGVAGAAAATVAAQAVMTVFLIAYSVKKHRMLRFRPGKRALDRWALAQGVRLGVPPMIQSSVSAFGSLLLQNFMNGFGTQTVAAITTAYRVDTMVLLPVINLGSGISTIVAQNYGAGEKARTKKVFAVGAVMMAVVSLLLTALVIQTGGHLIAMFGVGPESTEIGWRFFRRIASFYLVFGMATAMRGYLEGLGDVLYSSAAGVLSLLSRIILSYALAGLFGNMIIAYAEAFSWVLLLLLYLARMVWKNKSPPPA
ncbi:MATE family efflux transporter [Agathobaculum sp. NTUH-O15-33]|uniref:MATE family efflux transporter n=1 Tax=Agathobaculum sp. NTUH-O15-33 TaxID=3079302 RepID=UPI0029587C24|nr:MATE family efflux transporter [Agathobaculum sp. NTUH-O15-33]WNX85960.1 MATE family efflux transporter [Agathobaculum sp. NTUH-O15-33]